MPEPSKRTIFSGRLVITVLVIILVVSVAMWLNAGCQTTFETNLPLYPEAQIVDQDFPFLRNKWMLLHTSDSVTTVQNWYNRTVSLARANDFKNKTMTAWIGNFEI